MNHRRARLRRNAQLAVVGEVGFEAALKAAGIEGPGWLLFRWIGERMLWVSRQPLFDEFLVAIGGGVTSAAIILFVLWRLGFFDRHGSDEERGGPDAAPAVK